MRQIVLDTETTGLDWERGHRVIEIGCVEIINRRKTDANYHCFVNPRRAIDEAAEEVHGITSQFLADKPLFEDVARDFLEYIGDAELIIHNAEFDVGFLDNELRQVGLASSQLSKNNHVLDTLTLARQMHPGQRNSLDALCKRYAIDNSSRDLHGALLDARLLADVYLVMTGGQGDLSLDESGEKGPSAAVREVQRIERKGLDLRVVPASEADVQEHDAQLDLIDAACADGALWRRAEP